MFSITKETINWLRYKKNMFIKKNFRAGVRSGRMAIENAKVELEKIGSRICEFAGHIKAQEKTLATLKEELERWEKLCDKAVEANSENDVRIAVKNKFRIETHITELTNQINKDNEILQSIQAQHRERQNKLCQAEKHFLQLLIRKENAAIRKEMKATECGISSSSSFAQLDDFEKEVNREECEVEAIEEMADAKSGDSIEALEEKYDSNEDITVEKEVQRLLNK